MMNSAFLFCLCVCNNTDVFSQKWSFSFVEVFCCINGDTDDVCC